MGKAAKATRKRSKKVEVLMVDSQDKIPELEKLLKEGKITVVLVYADWCGACQKFKKNIWGPMCKSPAVHNRAAVRDDLVPSTSLANTKFNYLPSVLVVDEKGRPQTFEGPEGPTNAMPTPKSLNEMKTVVNIPVKPLGANGLNEKPIPEYLNARGESKMAPPEYLQAPTSTSTIEPIRSPMAATSAATATPMGTTYEPAVAPGAPSEQRGGGLVESRLMRFLRGVANGQIPISSLVPAGKGHTRRRRRSKRSGRKTRGRKAH
jgi:hypothetical protein